MIGQGTSQYTVKSIIDRLFMSILTPPDKQYAQVSLAVDVDDSIETIVLGKFTIPEDESLLRQGSILEAGQELMRVHSYDQAASSVFVTRGEYGTVPVEHSVPTLLNMNPPYTRASVFEAVADEMILLSPKLYTTGEELLSNVTDRVYSISDPLAVEVLSIWTGDFTSTVDVEGEIVDFHPMSGGRSLITGTSLGSVWLRYRKRMDKATSESDVLADLGVDERWVNIVMYGVAGDLLVGRDLTAAQTEWVKSVLEAENIRVGSRMSIAGGLRQYRNMLLDEAQAEMRNEYRVKVKMRRAIGSPT